MEEIRYFITTAINADIVTVEGLRDLTPKIIANAFYDDSNNALSNVKENPLETAEKSLEQNYNEIDGVINNVPTVKQEKPSILEALKKNKPITQKIKEPKHKDLDR